MRVPLAETRDTFDYRNLPPPEELERCALDYRTSPPPGDPDRITALRAVLWYVVLLAVAVPVLLFLSGFTLAELILFGVPASTYLVGSGLWKFLHAQPARPSLFGALACLAALVYIGLVKLLPLAEAAYLVGFGAATLTACWFADVAARQVAAWMTANLHLEWETATRWRGHWGRIARGGPVPSECPEVAQARAARPALAAGLIIGGVALEATLGTPALPWAGVIGACVAVALIPVAWAVTHVVTGTPLPPPHVTLRAAAWALFCWWGYNRHEARAPGVFQFPTTWCRSRRKRDAALGLTLATVALAFVPLTPVVARSVLERPAWVAHESIAASLPGRWLAAAWDARAHAFGEESGVGPPGAFTFPASCLFAAAGPPAFVFLVFWLLYGSVLTRFYFAIEAEGAPCRSTKWTPWDNAVDRLLNPPCGDGTTPKNLFLGRHYYLDYPVLLDRRILDEHAHITGGSGGGKTSLGVAPLLAQLIASEDCSVVVLDLKGDRALLRTAEIEARRSGADFKWFTNRREVSSFVFNPFRQSHLPRLTPNQVTQAVLQGLSLDYGEAYGKAFFTAMSEAALLKVIQQKQVGSFLELRTHLERMGSSGDRKEKDLARDSRHLAALVNRLCEAYPLNVTEAALARTPSVWDARIDAPEILRNRQVVYFYLSSPEESLSAPAIAKLLVYSLFTAAANRRPGEERRVYLFVDEFQRVTTQSVKLVLEQGRALGLSFIVVHQSSEQLAVTDRAMLQVVDECTAFKQVFRAQDEREVERLMDRSGMALYHTLRWQQEYDSRASRAEDWFRPAAGREGIVLVAETAGPRLDRNTVSELSAAPLASFVSFAVNRGFTQYGGYVTPVLCEYHVTEDEYDKRTRADWPEDPGRTVLVPPASSLNQGSKRKHAASVQEPGEPEDGDEAADENGEDYGQSFGAVLEDLEDL